MSDQNLLDHYFLSVYNKLEADALLFNRKLPHAGTSGSENETVLANVLREFLPRRHGIEVGALVIDRRGNVSKQCDIVLYDPLGYPKYFRKVFPIEVVYGVIEVKTSLSKKEAQIALENLGSVNKLDFRPGLTPYWQTRTQKEGLRHDPPFGAIFAYRTTAKTFETFAKWFPWHFLRDGIILKDKAPAFPEIRTLTVCALDQGLIKMESANAYVTRHAAIADPSAEHRGFGTRVKGNRILVDPAKSLLLFLETLWVRLSSHSLHPGFDIRSYMSVAMDSVVEVPFIDDG